MTPLGGPQYSYQKTRRNTKDTWHVWRVLRRHLSDLEAIQIVDCDEYLVVVTGEFRWVSQWESMGELCQCTQCISVHLSAQKIKNLWFFSRISGRLVQPVAENVLNIVTRITRIEKNAKVKRQAGSQSIRSPGWRRAKSISLLGRAKGYFWRCERTFVTDGNAQSVYET